MCNNNVYGYQIFDQNNNYFYLDNFEFDSILNSWHSLSKEITLKFKKIYSEKPEINLNVLIKTLNVQNTIFHNKNNITL